MNYMRWFLSIIGIAFLLGQMPFYADQATDSPLQPFKIVFPDGTLDQSFGAPNGFVITAAVPPANGIYIQADGKIVTVAGTDNPTQFFVTRYLTGGTLDVSFGVAGIATISLVALSVISVDANKVAVQSDGKIVVVGTLDGGTMFVARLTSTGSLDSTFNAGGTLPGVVIIPQFSPNGGDSGHAIVVDVDGKIVIAGTTLNVTEEMAIARLNSNGTLDATFNGTGQQTARLFASPMGNSSDVAFAVALASDGKTIIAAGASTPPVPNSSPLTFFPFTFSYARINPNGSIAFMRVAPFATNPGDLNNIFAQAFDVLVQPDSKVVLIGQTDWIDGQTYFALARFDSLGNLDPIFTSAPPSMSLNAGTFVSPTVGGGGNTENSLAFFGALQSDGKIIAVGGGPNSNVDQFQDIMLARYNGLDGSIDTAFNGGGAPAGFVWTSAGEVANAVALQGNGNIVIAGGNPSDTEQIVARYLVDSPPTPLVQTSIVSPTPGQAITAIFTFTGFAQSPSIVDLFVDGVLIGSTVTQDPFNNWSFTNTTPLAPGPHTLVVVGRYRDDGHVNLEATTTFNTCLFTVPALLADCVNGTIQGNLQSFITGGTGPLVFEQTGSTVGGTVSINPSGPFTFTASAGFSGLADFNFQVTDNLCTATGIVDILVSSPVAQSIQLPSRCNGSLTGNLAGLVSGGFPPFTFSETGVPVGGTVSINPAGIFSFTANAGFSGLANFVFEATDTQDCSATGRVSVDFVIPTVGSTAISACSNTLVGNLNNLVRGTGPFTFTGPISGISCQGGSVTINSNGLFNFTAPNTSFTGPCNFAYQAIDSLGCSGTGSVTIFPNAGPKVNNLLLATCFETPLRNTVALSVSGGTPPFTFTQTGPVINGSLIFGSNGNFVFTPASGVVGTGSFQFQATDFHRPPCTSNVGTVSIAIENCCPVPPPNSLFALFINSNPVT